MRYAALEHEPCYSAALPASTDAGRRALSTTKHVELYLVHCTTR